MRLKSITTTNFKKLGSQTITFTAGMNIISGDNAQGKSTLLQAIEAALFGVRAIPGKAEHIATWGQKKWALELHFEGKDLQQYCVIRNASTAKLLRLQGEENDLVANGTTPVLEAVEELLGLAAKDYNLFIQSKQGESTGILTFGATALNRKVEEYAGVQVIEKVQAAAQLKSTSLAASAEAKRVPEEVLSQAQADLDTAQQRLAEANAAHERAQGRLEELGEFSQPDVEDNVAAMRQEAHAADLLWAKVEAAQNAVSPAEQRASAARERCEGLSLQNVDDLVAKRSAALSRGNDLKVQLAALQGDKQGYAMAQQAVERCRSLHATALKQLVKGVDEATMAEAKDAVDGTQAVLDAAQAKVTELELKVRSIQQMADGAQCPTCGHAKEDHDPEKLAQELAQAGTELAGANAERKTARDAVDKARALVTRLNDQQRKADEATRAAGVAEAALSEAQANLDNLTPVDDSQIHDVEAQLDEARSEYGAHNEAIANAEANNLAYNKAQRALTEAEQALLDTKQAAQDLAQQFEDLPEPPTEEEIAQRQREVEAYREAQAAWKAEHGNRSMDEREAAADVRIAKQAVDTAKSTVERLDQQNAQAANDAALSKKYDRLVRFLREGRHGYMQQVWDTILNVSSRLVKESSRGQITRILNEDNEFMFEEGGIIAPSSSASGAQRSFIGTSLRTGLSRALYGSDSLMIFDEPTEACSEHNASAMAATLATSAKQVLMITHRETDQVLANKVIHIGA